MLGYIRWFIKKKKLYKTLGSIGQKVIIHPSCLFNHVGGIRIGNNVQINRNCVLSGHGGIVIGDGTVFANDIEVFSGEHNYDSDDLEFLPFDDRFINQKVEIGKYVWVGSHSVILPGVKIGDGAVIGACTVVTKDIPPLAVAVGNPAKVIKYRNREVYMKLANSEKSLIKHRK